MGFVCSVYFAYAVCSVLQLDFFYVVVDIFFLNMIVIGVFSYLISLLVCPFVILFCSFLLFVNSLMSLIKFTKYKGCQSRDKFSLLKSRHPCFSLIFSVTYLKILARVTLRCYIRLSYYLYASLRIYEEGIYSPVIWSRELSLRGGLHREAFTHQYNSSV